MRSRDVNLITVGGFRFGMLERVDSFAWRRLDVRVIGRGGEKKGFKGVGARTPDGRLSVRRGAHRGDKRRVVDEILIEVMTSSRTGGSTDGAGTICADVVAVGSSTGVRGVGPWTGIEREGRSMRRR